METEVIMLRKITRALIGENGKQLSAKGHADLHEALRQWDEADRIRTNGEGSTVEQYASVQYRLNNVLDELGLEVRL